jgi:hypothetical protein
MIKQEKHGDDLLKQFINPEMIEKAPEGFTTNLMMRINTETDPVKVKSGKPNRNYIPVISVAFTIILVMAAFLLSGGETDPSALPFTDLLKNVKLSLPDFNFASLFRFSLPSVVIYIFIGILVLSLFDRALDGAFHREK